MCGFMLQLRIDAGISQTKEDRLEKLAEECDIMMHEIDKILDPIISSCTKDAISVSRVTVVLCLIDNTQVNRAPSSKLVWTLVHIERFQKQGNAGNEPQFTACRALPRDIFCHPKSNVSLLPSSKDQALKHTLKMLDIIQRMKSFIVSIYIIVVQQLTWLRV